MCQPHTDIPFDAGIVMSILNIVSISESDSEVQIW